ncbi:hypothetical protein DPMN_154045 [Dreissena polymorpha]|uniref:Uncharacterized protein n=1 Tax=Dreissena polymorpha TaxID=45954 RepID=A0A9D4FL92_DREPO|nr:hypothetical protein DPMN_154045 [Dreissena polymorpha]
MKRFQNCTSEQLFQGWREIGRQSKRWGKDISEWTRLSLSEALILSERGEEWRELVARSPVVPKRSPRLRIR